MTQANRRSWLMVPTSKPALIEEAFKSTADVIVLDLCELVAEKDRQPARGKIQAAISSAQSRGAEVFVQIHPQALDADLHACVWFGLSGIVMSRAESPQQIELADALLTELEAERGIAPGSVSIVPAVETALGNHAAYDIVRASKRVWGVTLGRADLVMDLRPEPSQELHLMPYLMQRLVIIAGAAGVAPIGAWWRAPDRGLLATPENTLRAAKRGRAIGFRGAMCLRADQVEPINRVFDESAAAQPLR